MRVRLIAGSLACAYVAACSSASVPSPTAPATNTAAITVSSVVATADRVPAGAVYHVSLQLKETGGQSGATISSVLFTLQGGAGTLTSTYTPPAAQRVAPAGSLDFGPITITDSAGASTSIASDISVAVSFTDDRGQGGSASGKGPITRPATYTLTGLVTDGTSGSSGRMPNVIVQIVDGGNAGLSAVTDATGNYAITGISPGSFTLSASTTSYETMTEKVSVSADTRVDFVLPRRLAGTWTGTGVDSMGTIILTWGLIQTGASISGSVKMQAVDTAGSCNSCHRNKSGTFSGTVSGTAVTLSMSFPTGAADDPTPACSATLTATASSVAGDALAAAYSGVDSCEPPALNGTVVMTRNP